MREEILAGPLEIYTGDRGATFPDVSEDPNGDFTLIGESGDENYTDDGVSVSLPQTIEEFIPAGATMAVKAFRTEEAVEVVVNVADHRLATWAHALNENEETEDDGTREMSLYRGGEVKEVALLCRGKSPYEDDGDDAGQFQIPACYMSGEPEVSFVKGEPHSVELTFRSLLPTDDEKDDFKIVFSDAETAA